MQVNINPRSVSLIGKELAGGRYRVTAKLAEGGMGFVYRAEDQHLGSDVVIKMPRPEMIRLSAERFSSEIRSLVQFAHPHILRIIDVGEYEGTPFAVMQFLAGGSLEERMRQTARSSKTYAIDLLQHWLRPIALALDFIHSQSYVHRDVKPGNILFDSYGNPFLSDFGVGKVIGSIADRQRGDTMSTPGAIVGTPQYMAPELTAGNSFDGRADQYALAVCIYELLTGRRPFEGNTVVAIHIEQMGDGPVRLDSLCDAATAPLADAVHRGLAYQPQDRFATCVEFADAVLSAIGVRSTAVPVTLLASDQAPLLPRFCVNYKSELSRDDVFRTVRDNIENWRGELLRFDSQEIVFHTKLTGNWLDRLLKKSQGPSLKVQLALAPGDERQAQLSLSMAWPEDDLLQEEIETQANHLLSQLIVKLRLFPVGETKVEVFGMDTTAATAVIGVPSLHAPPAEPLPIVEEYARQQQLEGDPYSATNSPSSNHDTASASEEAETGPANAESQLDEICRQITHTLPAGRGCMLVRLDSPRICGRSSAEDSAITDEHFNAFAEFAMQLCRSNLRRRNGSQEIFVRFTGTSLYIRVLKQERMLMIAAIGETTSQVQAATVVRSHLPTLKRAVA